jgi:hypothetical protein
MRCSNPVRKAKNSAKPVWIQQYLRAVHRGLNKTGAPPEFARGWHRYPKLLCESYFATIKLVSHSYVQLVHLSWSGPNFAAGGWRARKMGTEFGLQDRQDRMVREWLLILLRFAVTHEPLDQSAAVTIAEELDSRGRRWRPAAARFFVRTTNEVCEAIVAVNDDRRDAVLRKHLARIDDPRLRQAFRSAVGLQLPPERLRPGAKAKKKKDLWKGLAKR